MLFKGTIMNREEAKELIKEVTDAEIDEVMLSINDEKSPDFGWLYC